MPAPATGLDLVFDLAQKGGAGVSVVFALMWYLERKDRMRLQRIMEGYLVPMVENTGRVARGMRRALTGSGNGERDDFAG